MPRIVPCRQEHLDALLELLQDAGLPGEGVEAHLRTFWVAQAGAEVVGGVGLERHGATALLRSLVVRQDRRRSGLGAALVRRAVAEARKLGARQVLLLTTAAAGFFRLQGFEPVALDGVPESVRASAGFFPAGAGAAVCMRLRLGEA